MRRAAQVLVLTLLLALVLLGAGTANAIGDPGSYRDTVLVDQPRAYWRLNEAGGSTAYDASGNAVSAGYQGAQSGAAGALGSDTERAATFDGDDHVAAGDRFDFSGTAPFSLEAWIYPTEINENAWHMIMAKHWNNPAGRQGYLIYLNRSPAGLIQLGAERFRDGGNDWVLKEYAATAFPLNTWYHVAVTYDGNEYAMYVNGTEVGRRTGQTRQLLDTSVDFSVGAFNWQGNPAARFRGRIDEPAVYDRALSADRVRAHFLASPAYQAAVLADSPQAYWRLSEAPGSTTAADTSRNAVTASYSGPTLQASGALGDASDTAVYFDGVDDVVQPGDRFDFAGTSAFTLEAWVYPAVVRQSTWHMVFSKAGSDANGRQGYLFWLDRGSDGVVTLGAERWRNNVSQGVYHSRASDRFPLNTWYHVAAVYAGSSFTLFLNGTQVAQRTNQTQALLDTADSLRIGSANGWGRFEGRIDEPAIYDRALSAAQIRAHFLSNPTYQAVALGDTPSALWRLGEPTGSTTAVDSSGNGRVATYSGTTLSQGGGLRNDANSSASFDGIDDAVTGPDALDFPGRAPFTVEAWIYPTAVNPGGWHMIVNKDGTDAGGRQGYELWLNREPNDEIRVAVERFRDGTVDLVEKRFSEDAFPLNAWHHVATTYDGNFLALHVDGTKVAEYPYGWRDLKDTTFPLRIGSANGWGRFVGRIDEVAVYSQALTEARLRAHYLTGARLERHIVMLDMNQNAASVAADMATSTGGSLVSVTPELPASQSAPYGFHGFFVMETPGVAPAAVMSDARMAAYSRNSPSVTFLDLAPEPTKVKSARTNVKPAIRQDALRARAVRNAVRKSVWGPRLFGPICDPPWNYGAPYVAEPNPQKNHQISAYAGDWDTDGACTNSYTFTWQRYANGVVTNVHTVSIQYPNKWATYTPGDGDCGAQLRVWVTAYATSGAGQAYSGFTNPVYCPPPPGPVCEPPEATSAPYVANGNPQVNVQVSGYAGDWDTDGVCTNSYTITWQTLAGGTVTNVQTSSIQWPSKWTNFTPRAEHCGKNLRIWVTAYATTGAGQAVSGWTNPVYCPPVQPETEITLRPSDPARTYRPTYEFRSPNVPGASFECSLDGAAYSGCSSPWVLGPMMGSHSVAIRAVNGTLRDDSPATHSFSIISPSCSVLPPAPRNPNTPTQCLPAGLERIGGIESDQRTGDGVGSASSIVVGVLDSGIGVSDDLNVPFPRRNCDDDATVVPDHGTMVAGVIGAKDNDFGVVGVLPGAKLYDLRIDDPASVVTCLYFAVSTLGGNPDDDIRIVNMSISVAEQRGENCDVNPSALLLAICTAYRNNIRLVAAAGNGGCTQAPGSGEGTDFQFCFPATYSHVLTATAFTDRNGTADGPSYPSACEQFSEEVCSFYSNFARPAPAPAADRNHTIAAPGDLVCAALPGNQYSCDYPVGTGRRIRGTSFSAPLIAGALGACRLAGACAADPSAAEPAYDYARLRNDAESYSSTWPYFTFGGSPSFPMPNKYFGHVVPLLLY
jgi:subtilisin